MMSALREGIGKTDGRSSICARFQAGRSFFCSRAHGFEMEKAQCTQITTTRKKMCRGVLFPARLRTRCFYKGECVW